MRRALATCALSLIFSVCPTRADATPIVPPSPIASYAVGQQPNGLVGDPLDGRLYVANSGTRTLSGAGSISVVDPLTGSVSAIETSKPSAFLALDSAGRRLYSSNYDPTTDTVSFDQIDLNTGTVISTLGVGGLMTAIDTDSSRVYVAGGVALYAVDTTSFSVTTTRSSLAGQLWFGVALDPALHHVYVTNIVNSSPSVAILDDRDFNVLDEVPLTTVPRFAIAVDSASHRVFVGGAEATGQPFTASAVYAIDGSTGSVVASTTLRGFPMGLVLAPASRRLYVTDGYGFVPLPLPGRPINELDMDTLRLTLTLVSPGQPAMPHFGPDGRLYVTRMTGSAPGMLDAYDLTPRNVPPMIDSMMVTPAEAYTNDLLTANVTAHDDNGDSVTVSYQWSVRTSGVARVLDGETSRTLDLAKPGNGDREDAICLTVTVSDSALQTSATNCFLFVRDSAPAATVALTPSAPTATSTMRATASSHDPDGDAVSYTYTWRVNGLVRRTTTTTQAFDFLDLLLHGARKGDLVAVDVVPSDGLLSGPAVSGSVTVVNSAPTVAVSLSATNPRPPDMLTATATGADPDGDALAYTYTWTINGRVARVTQTSAGSDAFDLRSNRARTGDLVGVSVIASDGSASSAAATALATVGKK